ncbi:MAG: chorismate lyase [Pseudomonadales bacterium]|nr:chorismate lyase [Pseudomonadales bacterium]MCP5166061.1 chorismate lyase [Pseudomonadales bacterium]MCP5187256.1 chorismate lyase [Pseudomonadales bacterium]
MPTPNQTRHVSGDPRWRPVGEYNAASLPHRQRYWLLDEGSLTARLTGLQRGDFSVRRLSQRWEQPLPSERRLLGMPLRQRGLVREVALMLGCQAVVFARSVFPVTSLAGELGHLRQLQNKSLGSILFGHPGMRRSPFELARITGDSHYLPPSLRQAVPAWGRRSRFLIGGRDLLVSEVFLEGFVPWQPAGSLRRSQRGKVDAAIVQPTQ